VWILKLNNFFQSIGFFFEKRISANKERNVILNRGNRNEIIDLGNVLRLECAFNAVDGFSFLD